MDSFWSDLWDLAKTAGPFGTAYATLMWWLERNERVSRSIKYDALLERVLTAMATGTAAIEKFSELIARRRT